MSISQNFPALKPSLLLDFANTKRLDDRITFARASEGRYYGQEVAKAEENLILRSQEFNVSPWSVSNGSITGTNTETAPDGTLTADVFTSSAAFGTVQQTSTIIAGQTYTFSCWIKAGTSTSDWSLYDASAAITIATITPSASWQRIEGSWTPTVNNAILRITDRDNDNTGSVVLWGAQLEQRSSVTAYTPTTTQPITNYTPVLQTASANIARFDHDPVTGESLGLLVEEQRTNLVTYSEQFDNAAWSKTRATITANAIVAPDGTLTGEKLVQDSGVTSAGAVFRGLALTAASYTCSVYAKAAEKSFLVMRQEHTGGYTYFNLATGVLGTVAANTTASITPAGNDWYHCSITFTGTTTNANAAMFYLAETNNSLTVTGDGYSGIYLWGAQLEAGAFPTSYIHTTTSQVTRSADSASMTGENFSSWYSQGEGTVYVEDISRDTLSTQYVFNLQGATNSDYIGKRIGSGGSTAFYINTSGSLVASLTVGTVGTTYTANKSCVSYSFNDSKATQNSSTVATDTVCTIPTIASLAIGQWFSGSNIFNGHIKKLSYYPQALTATNLQALTS